MQSKCSQNAVENSVKMQSKCSQKFSQDAVKLQSNCSRNCSQTAVENAVEMQSKYSPNAVIMPSKFNHFLECLWTKKFSVLLHKIHEIQKMGKNIVITQCNRCHFLILHRKHHSIKIKSGVQLF